jgi:hypothetical protein
MSVRVSGWILPDGSWLDCYPWEHIRFAKSLPLTLELRETDAELAELWDHLDEERLRSCLARLGFVKVCYHMVDADFLSGRQLRMLQQVYGFHPLETELEFIGRIRGRLELRLLMKMRDPDRLNNLA